MNELAEPSDSAAGPAVAGRPRLTESAIVGTHSLLDEVRGFARSLASKSRIRALVSGAPGTGKTLLARVIHDLSGAPGPLVIVSCADLFTPDFHDEELFGATDGELASVQGRTRSAFSRAENGTLVLDGVGALRPQIQARLSATLSSDEALTRRGGTSFNLIACTNGDLRERTRARAFLPGLMRQLDKANVDLPPLVRMPGVVAELAEHFVRETCRIWGRPLPVLSARSFSGLLDYDWPGNVRQLGQIVEHAVLSRTGSELILRAPASPFIPSGVLLPHGLSLEEVERRYIAATFDAFPGLDYVEVATKLGIARKTLWEKRRRYGL